MLLTVQVVRGSVGLGFVIRAVHPFVALLATNVSDTADCSLLTIQESGQPRPLLPAPCLGFLEGLPDLLGYLVRKRAFLHRS